MMKKKWKKYKITKDLTEYIFLGSGAPWVIFDLKFKNYMKEAVYRRISYSYIDGSTFYMYKLETVRKRR